MARGPKKHLKRVAAPKSWYLDKLNGLYAPRPSPGPHRRLECVPLSVLLRNKLKYALTYQETLLICQQRLVEIDGKVRTDRKFPLGFMDVVTIAKTSENFRMLYDTKGRFVPHKIRPEEAAYKLCRIKSVRAGQKNVPYATTHDGRTIRYIHPEVKKHDTVRLDINNGKILDFVKFELGNLVMITGGHNIGRIGTIVHREKHPGSIEIVHVKDVKGHTFATRINNVFVIGKGNKAWISLPKGQGIRLTNIEDRSARLAKQRASV